MRLDHLAELELTYRDLVVIAPYGDDGVACGEGDGRISGERLTGRARWSNHPKRRADGVFLPDAHGVIETDDGAIVLFHLRGRTSMSGGAGTQNLIVLFETEADPYRWLNDQVCVAEGIIADGAMKAQVYVCVNELA